MRLLAGNRMRVVVGDFWLTEKNAGAARWRSRVQHTSRATVNNGQHTVNTRSTHGQLTVNKKQNMPKTIVFHKFACIRAR